MSLKNKLIAIVSALSMLSCMAPTTTAETMDSNIMVDLTTVNDGTISPRYTNFATVTAGMTINSNNTATCNGSYYLYSTMKSTITVTLMYSPDKKNWYAVDDQSWTNTYTTSGSHTGGGTSTCTLSSSYYYCTNVQVTAYNSSNNVIEVASCSSNAYHI